MTSSALITPPYAVAFNFEPEIRVVDENAGRDAADFAGRSRTTIHLFPIFILLLIVGGVIWLISEMRK